MEDAIDQTLMARVMRLVGTACEIVMGCTVPFQGKRGERIVPGGLWDVAVLIPQS